MSGLRRRRYNMGIRVRVFGEENSIDFPINSAGDTNFKEVVEAILMMEQGGVTQVSGASKQHTSNKATARGELREILSTISRTAKALAVDDDSLSNLFQQGNIKNEQRLLATARSFQTHATPIKTRFIEYGLDETFPEDLDEAINNFARAILEQGSNKNTQVAGTALADEGMERLMNAVRRLKAIVPNKYVNDPTKLAEWTTASHVEKAGQTKETTENGEDSNEENPS